MIWLEEIVCQEEQLLIQYYVIKHLILLKIKNMINIKMDLHQWIIHFLIKKTAGTSTHTGTEIN